MKLLNLAKTPAAIVIAVLILMGCTAMTGRQSVGEAVDDSSITAKVKSSFVGRSGRQCRQLLMSIPRLGL